MYTGDRGRNETTTRLEVYSWPAVDLLTDDRLDVRGTRYQVPVEQWRSAYGTSRSGTVARCTRQEG